VECVFGNPCQFLAKLNPRDGDYKVAWIISESPTIHSGRGFSATERAFTLTLFVNPSGQRHGLGRSSSSQVVMPFFVGFRGIRRKGFLICLYDTPRRRAEPGQEMEDNKKGRTA
jgi:hypothetical protein